MNILSYSKNNPNLISQIDVCIMVFGEVECPSDITGKERRVWTRKRLGILKKMKNYELNFDPSLAMHSEIVSTKRKGCNNEFYKKLRCKQLSTKCIYKLHNREPSDYGTAAVTIFIENELEP